MRFTSGRVPAQSEQPVRMRFGVNIALVLLVAAASAVFIGLGLWWGLGKPAISKTNTWTPTESFNFTKIVISVVGGIGGVVALVVAYRKQRLGESAERREEDKRFAEDFTKATEQLGSEQASVRLSGMYALERLGQNTPEQQQTIVNVLCAYLRMPYSNLDPVSSKQPLLPMDDQDANRGGAVHLYREIRREHETHKQEHQVRLTAQRILCANISPMNDRRSIGQSIWEDVDLDLTGAQALNLDLQQCKLRIALFDGAEFEGTANFDGTRFIGAASFSGARFNDGAGFSETRFQDGANFDDAALGGDVSFAGAQFFKDAAFGAACFQGEVTFKQSRFKQEASFHKSAFKDRVNFDSATFGGAAVFDEVTYAGEARFCQASFNDFAGFDNAKFQGHLVFSRAGLNAPPFKGLASFRCARFNGNVQFDHVDSFDFVDFDHAYFRQDAKFNGFRFRELASFECVQFDSMANFEESVFENGLNFHNAKMNAKSSFRGAMVWRDVPVDTIWERPPGHEEYKPPVNPEKEMSMDSDHQWACFIPVSMSSHN